MNRNLGGIKYDNLQAHHIIPEEIWEDNITFMDDIGVGGNMDNKENGVLMPDSADKAKQMKRKFYHCGSHDVYSRAVQEEISEIASAFYSGAISDGEARQEISAIQVRNRMWLKTPAIPGTSPIRLR
ncbi:MULTISPECIES: AHH domain-containing protein [unclassified Pseudomonas]|uniref:AHH domain-containing protein n=2 Tax=unclassified Pseudomonas TaxID=196821 RepID=UPI0023799591|nr:MULTISPECIES: AHH domain-containing protein [unclassified Pseudomonas]